jgi:tocopherol O-methyltransferase
MEMTWIEKRLVNRPGKAEGNIARVREQLSRIESSGIEDVLELGCGIGGVSAHLARTYGWRVYGTDYDPDQIALAQQRNGSLPNPRYQREDAAQLSFSDGSFDLSLISERLPPHR